MKLVESHPYIWWLAWTAVNELPIFLPHDASYFALKHFGRHSNSLFLDIGANTGISALDFRRFYASVPIYSLEPNPIHERRLAGLKKRLLNFDYLVAGAGDVDSELTFFTPVYHPVVLHTFTSTSEDLVLRGVIETFGERVRKRLTIVKSEARIVRIDDLNLEPSIIKIDAEGFDYQVVLGAAETIRKNRPFLMVEVAHSEFTLFKQFFDDLDYGVYWYDPQKDVFGALTRGRAECESNNLFVVPNESTEDLPLAPR